MEINATLNDNILELKADGRIDAITAPDFQAKGLEIIKENTAATMVLVDFSAIEYISSAGLRSILMFAKVCQQYHKKFGCFALTPAVYEVFKISGFTSIIKIANDREQILQLLA